MIFMQTNGTKNINKTYNNNKRMKQMCLCQEYCIEESHGR